MRTHTNDYKNTIKTLGREIDAKITFNGTTITSENINSVSLHYEGAILKSVMKQLDLDLNIDIPINTIFSAQFGINVNGTYEYINLGTFVVYKSEKQEDVNSYKLTCYDKMLYSMKDYEDMGITYPITIKDYLKAICDYLGLTFTADDFVNSDKVIQNELYLDTEGNSLGYTFRDVLDELAEVTASTICVDDELEIRYIQNIGTYQTIEGTNIHIYEVRDISDFDIELYGDTYQETTTGKQLFNYATTNYVQNETVTITGTGNNFTISSTGYGLRAFYIGQIDFPTLYAYMSSSYTSASIALYVTNNSNYNSWNDFYNDRTRIANNWNITQTNSISLANYQGKYLWITLRGSYTDSGYTNVNYKDFILSKESVSAYEPYTNGASPNPDYPQNIEVVTGRQEINVVGKNRIDNTNINYDFSNVNTSENSLATIDTGIRYSTTRYDGSPVVGFKSIDLTPYIGKVVRMKANYSSKGRIRIGLTNSAVSTRTQKAQSVGVNETISFVVPNDLGDTPYLFYAFIIQSPTSSNNSVDFTDVVLTIDDEDMSYQPYKGKNYEINLGKNLFDKDNANVLNANFSNNVISSNSADRMLWLKCLPNTTYTITRLPSTPYARFSIANTIEIPTIGVSYHNIMVATTTDVSATYTTSASAKYLCVLFFNTSSTTYTLQQVLNSIQIEKGNQATSYSRYFTPIELAKINTYKDRIFKSSGKNLIDIDNSESGGINSSGTLVTGNNLWRANQYIEVTPNTTYTLSRKTFSDSKTRIIRLYEYNSSQTFISPRIETQNESLTITTTANTKYLKWTIYEDNATLTLDIVKTWNLQLEEGNQATSFEPYGKDWYIEKNTRKLELAIADMDNSNDYPGWKGQTQLAEDFPNINGPLSSRTTYICNIATFNVGGISINTTGSAKPIFLMKSTFGLTQPQWKEQYPNLIFKLYYGTPYPYYEKITNTELISQLESIQLQEGINNISVGSGNLSSPITLKYLSERDTIDEEFLKDVNVNFGEVYGPINTIALTRAEADTISQSIPSDLADEDKIAIEIKDNQIMNFEDRADYIPEILAKLRGLTYYLNDFASTGITYYDLCDKYDVSIDGNLYGCVMLNDEINITQGLEENVFTEMPKQAEVEYRYTTTDDRISQVQLSVNKQEGRIEAIATDINGENGIRETLDSQARTIEVKTRNIDDNGNVTEVTTTNGFTFNKNGLNIYTDANSYNTLINNVGTYYKDGDDIISETTKDGVMSKDFKQRGLHQYSWNGSNYDFSDERVEVDGEACYATFYNGND